MNDVFEVFFGRPKCKDAFPITNSLDDTLYYELSAQYNKSLGFGGFYTRKGFEKWLEKLAQESYSLETYPK